VSRWPVWSPVAEAGALLRYVRPDLVGLLLPALPEPSGQEPAQVLQRIYETVAGLGIRYQHEPAAVGTAGQLLRSPDEVLARPKHATCLDLAVVFAGACERARLRATVAIVGGVSGGAEHAFLLVGADPGPPVRRPADAELRKAPDAVLDGDARTAPTGAGALLAVDVTLAAASRPDGADPAPFEAAVAAGARLVGDVAAKRRDWVAGVDVAAGYDPARREDPGPAPALDVLLAPYHPPADRPGPLAQLRARNGVVPFIARAELDTLRAWCEAEPTGAVVLYGAGGSGKTHLAAELCRRMAEDGWHAGFLSGEAARADLEWLAGVVSPVLVVVDYAEDTDSAELATLLRLLHTRPAESPGWVLFTARAKTRGGWQDDLNKRLKPAGLALRLERTLPRSHPRTTGVFRRAYSAFGGPPGRVDPPQVSDPRWTTLDLVMLAYLAAHGERQLPDTRKQLYDEILDEHELPYWKDVARERRGLRLGPDVLAQAGATVTLFAPTRHRVPTVLRALLHWAFPRDLDGKIFGQRVP